MPVGVEPGALLPVAAPPVGVVPGMLSPIGVAAPARARVDLLRLRLVLLPVALLAGPVIPPLVVLPAIGSDVVDPMPPAVPVDMPCVPVLPDPIEPELIVPEPIVPDWAPAPVVPCAPIELPELIVPECIAPAPTEPWVIEPEVVGALAAPEPIAPVPVAPPALPAVCANPIAGVAVINAARMIFFMWGYPFGIR